MFTNVLHNKCTPKLYNRTIDLLDKIHSAIFQLAVIRTPKIQKLNVCCYCNQTRNLSKVRHFYVCSKHLKAWGIV